MGSVGATSEVTGRAVLGMSVAVGSVGATSEVTGRAALGMFAAVGSIGATSEVTGKVVLGIDVVVENGKVCRCEMVFGGFAGVVVIAEPLVFCKNVAIAVVGFASN